MDARAARKSARMIPHRRTVWGRIKEHWMYYAMMTPGFAIVLVFAYLPMVGLVIAFNDYNPIFGVSGFWKSEWVGLKWFVKFFKSFFFERLMVNTLLINFTKLLFMFPIPIFFALLLNEVRCRWYKKTIQTVTYLPHFISWVVIVGMMSSMLSPTTGFVNNIIAALGGEKIYFMNSESWFYPLIVGSAVWCNFGWDSIIYLAAISGVDTEMYESAVLDGCSRFKQALYITLPSIKSLIVMMLILKIGGLINADFAQILAYIGNNTALYKIGDVIDTYVYRIGIQNLQLSYATAIGMFKGVIALIMLGGANLLAKKIGEDGVF